MIDALAPPTTLAAIQRAWPGRRGQFADALRAGLRAATAWSFVACDSAVWASELDLMSERVVANLNDALGRSRRAAPEARGRRGP